MKLKEKWNNYQEYRKMKKAYYEKVEYKDISEPTNKMLAKSFVPALLSILSLIIALSVIILNINIGKPILSFMISKNYHYDTTDADSLNISEEDYYNIVYDNKIKDLVIDKIHQSLQFIVSENYESYLTWNECEEVIEEVTLECIDEAALTQEELHNLILCIRDNIVSGKYIFIPENSCNREEYIYQVYQNILGTDKALTTQEKEETLAIFDFISFICSTEFIIVMLFFSAIFAFIAVFLEFKSKLGIKSLLTVQNSILRVILIGLLGLFVLDLIKDGSISFVGLSLFMLIIGHLLLWGMNYLLRKLLREKI